MSRHCVVTQKRVESAPFLSEVSLGGVHVAFGLGGVGHDKETGQNELTEDAGITAEKRPQRYDVEWRDGARPAIKANKLPRTAQGRRLEPPNRDEVIALGVAEPDADKAVAFQRFLHAQQVFPYGTRPLPPDGSEKMLERFLKAKAESEPAPASSTPKDEDPGEKPRGGRKTHYHRRAEDLAALVESPTGGDDLRAIIERMGLTVSANKREMADSVLAKEFPRDHKPAAAPGDQE